MRPPRVRGRRPGALVLHAGCPRAIPNRSGSATARSPTASRALRRGRPADRRPTIEQLVAAFGEAEATPDARRRAARALALARVAALPDVLEAAPGERVVLEVRRPRSRGALLLGVLALAALFGAAGAVASQMADDTAGNLPAGTTTAATTTVTAEPTTTAAPEPQPTAAQRRRARRARERRARERRARAAARRRVTVRLNASDPTFLCVDGDGRRLFDGSSAARGRSGRGWCG
jgi:hypothetical protein